MDTLSSSVSTFKVPSLLPHHRDFHHFKTPPYASSSPRRPAQAQAQTQAQAYVTLIPKTKPFSHKNPNPLFSETPSLPPNPIFYQKPATGYAAALVDVAQTTGSLHVVHRDVRRLLKKASYEEEEPVHSHVGALVKMLVKKKKKSGIFVRKVLKEFERIYDELCGTQVVWVSSEKKMEEYQVFGIAESGTVKVKVRNLVHS